MHLRTFTVHSLGNGSSIIMKLHLAEQKAELQLRARAFDGALSVSLCASCSKVELNDESIPAVCVPVCLLASYVKGRQHGDE